MKKDWDFVVNFGKHKGKSLTQILDDDPSYIVWLAEKDVLKVDDDLLLTALKENDYNESYGMWYINND